MGFFKTLRSILGLPVAEGPGPSSSVLCAGPGDRRSWVTGRSVLRYEEEKTSRDSNHILSERGKCEQGHPSLRGGWELPIGTGDWTPSLPTTAEGVDRVL